MKEIEVRIESETRKEYQNEEKSQTNNSPEKEKQITKNQDSIQAKTHDIDSSQISVLKLDENEEKLAKNHASIDQIETYDIIDNDDIKDQIENQKEVNSSCDKNDIENKDIPQDNIKTEEQKSEVIDQTKAQGEDDLSQFNKKDNNLAKMTSEILDQPKLDIKSVEKKHGDVTFDEEGEPNDKMKLQSENTQDQDSQDKDENKCQDREGSENTKELDSNTYKIEESQTKNLTASNIDNSVQNENLSKENPHLELSTEHKLLIDCDIQTESIAKVQGDVNSKTESQNCDTITCELIVNNVISKICDEQYDKEINILKSDNKKDKTLIENRYKQKLDSVKASHEVKVNQLEEEKSSLIKQNEEQKLATNLLENQKQDLETKSSKGIIKQIYILF